MSKRPPASFAGNYAEGLKGYIATREYFRFLANKLRERIREAFGITDEEGCISREY